MIDNSRFKNPYFYVGLFGVIIAASGVDVSTLTNWSAVLQALLDVLNNPVALVAVGLAALGVFINPNTSGISD